jgi:hypothetical protein
VNGFDAVHECGNYSSGGFVMVRLMELVLMGDFKDGVVSLGKDPSEMRRCHPANNVTGGMMA